MICMGNLGGVFSCKNTPECHTETHKCSLFPYKQVNGNGDHEWLRMTNAFILCDLLWKVQKNHVSSREGSFNMVSIFMPYYVLFPRDLHILDLRWRSPLCSLLLCGYYPCVHYFYVPWLIMTSQWLMTLLFFKLSTE